MARAGGLLLAVLGTASAQTDPAVVDVFRSALELRAAGCTVPLPVPDRDVETGLAPGGMVCTQRNNVPGGVTYDMCGAKRVADGEEGDCAAMCAGDTELSGGCTGFGYVAGQCHLYVDSANCGSADALNWWTCAVPGGGHRRAQQGLPFWGQGGEACDAAGLQERSARVDLACCADDSCSTSGGLPTHCSYGCAVEFVPFWDDCGALLTGMGQDLSPTNAMCIPDAEHLPAAQAAVAGAVCPNAILSCHHGVTCIDAVTGGGQVPPTPAELLRCAKWTGLGGGWTASAENCAGVTGNIVTNGGFESPVLSASDCMGGHDSSHRGDDHCQYKYLAPVISEFCLQDCVLDGWTIGQADAADATRVAVLENGNAPWGGLDSHMGNQFLSLQGSGAYIEQQLTGLTRGAVYELRVRLANRPGYGSEESLTIKLDNRVIAESAHPADLFVETGVAFTAGSTSSVLRLENDSPGNGDQSIFLDEVTVTLVQLGASVALENGNFDEDDLGERDEYLYRSPTGWAASGSVIVSSGSAAWGGLTSSGLNYLSLQGLGAFVEQILDGLTVGSTYIVEFTMADRPGFGEDEACHVKVDGIVIWESTHPEDSFNELSAVFTATTTAPTLKFENDSPEGDRSIFIDNIRVSVAMNALSVVLPTSSADSQPFDFDLLSTPMTWDDAEAECVRRNRHLASIHTDEESAFAAAMHHGNDAEIYDGMWIGGRDNQLGLTTDGTWTWEDSSDWDYVNWGPEEPNNGHGAMCDNTVTIPQCGENCAVMSAHLSSWTDHADTGGGNDGTAGREDYQWNDSNCDGLQQGLCGSPSQAGSRSLLAYYSFDGANAADESGNHRDGVIEGAVSFVDTGVTGKAAQFDGSSRITVSSFRNWAWGDHFAVSVWCVSCS